MRMLLLLLQVKLNLRGEGKTATFEFTENQKHQVHRAQVFLFLQCFHTFLCKTTKSFMFRLIYSINCKFVWHMKVYTTLQLSLRVCVHLILFAGRMFEQPVSQLWETSHVWSLTESEWSSLLTRNIRFHMVVESLKEPLCSSLHVSGLSNSWLEDWMMSTANSTTVTRSRQSEFSESSGKCICA